MSFGKRLSYLRSQQNLTQNELAGLTSISRSRLSLYETDKREPDLQTLNQLADFFNVTSDYLIGRNDPIPLKSNPEISHEEIELLQQIKKASADKQKAIELILNMGKEQAAASGK